MGMAKAPGKAFRKGITFKQIMRIFPDNESAEAWFIGQRWPNGLALKWKSIFCAPQCLLPKRSRAAWRRLDARTRLRKSAAPSRKLLRNCPTRHRMIRRYRDPETGETSHASFKGAAKP